MSRLSVAVMLAMTTAVVVAILVGSAHYPILGWDSYLVLASSIIESPHDLWIILTRPIAEGRQPYDFQGFVRPMLNLSFALDYALWGADPLVYNVSQTLLFGACAFAVYVLVTRLIGGKAIVGPVVAWAVFVLLPSHIETLAVVARRTEPLVGLFGVIALLTQSARADRPMPRGAVFPALWTLLAVESKATGYVFVPLIPLLVFLQTSKVGFSARTRQAILATIPHAIVALIALILRMVILRGIGGHSMSRVSAVFDRLPTMASELAGWLLWPQPLLADSFVTRGLVAVLGVSLALAIGLGVRATVPGARESLKALVPAAVISVVWWMELAALYAIVGILQSWYVFVAALAFAVLVGTVAECFWRVGRGGSCRRVCRARGPRTLGRLDRTLLGPRRRLPAARLGQRGGPRVRCRDSSSHRRGPPRVGRHGAATARRAEYRSHPGSHPGASRPPHVLFPVLGRLHLSGPEGSRPLLREQPRAGGARWRRRGVRAAQGVEEPRSGARGEKKAAAVRALPAVARHEGRARRGPGRAGRI